MAENTDKSPSEGKPKFQPRDNVKDLNAEARMFIAEAMSDLDKYQG